MTVSSGGLIFLDLTDSTTDPTGTYGPTSPGGALPITGYTGSSNEAGAYRISLTGTQFVVPESGTCACLLVSTAGVFHRSAPPPRRPLNLVFTTSCPGDASPAG